MLGDFNPVYSTHHALNSAIRQVQTYLEYEIQFDWIATDILNAQSAFPQQYCGLWIAPGSPYRDMENVLNVIRHARQNDLPTLGNCGGFQHMILEFARNVCGIRKASHAETDPSAEIPVISELACSLIEQQEQLKIVDSESMVARVIPQTKFIGYYYCNYGVNPEYVELLASKGLSFTVVSTDGQMRAFELKSHPFFVGTLFQPALTSTAAQPDPIIVEFVKRSTCLI